MKVLTISNFFPPNYNGGAENSAYHTCLALLEQGIDCQVLTINHRASKSVDRTYQYDNIPVQQVEFAFSPSPSRLKDLFDWRIFRRVQKTLKNLKPDIVHIHNTSGTSLAPYVACRLAGIPVVNTLHDFWLLCPCNLLYQRDGTFCDPRQYPQGCNKCFQRYDYWADVPHRRRIIAKLTSNVKTFITPSQAVIEKHIWAGYDPQRFRWIPHIVSKMSLKPTNDPAVKDIVETAANYRTLLFVGGGIKIKGVRVLIDALPKLIRHIENLRVVVAGGGEEHYLRQLAHFEPIVQVLGRVPNKEVQHLYASADLTLVLSTCHETSSMVTYENHQHGTPIVGSNFGGVPVASSFICLNESINGIS